MDFLSFVISALGGGVVALGAAAWLFRVWIKHRLDIELATHKTQLAQKADALKTELSIYAHEQNVGLSRIDAQRSEAVLSIWKILLDWQEVFMSLTAPNERLEKNPGQAVTDYEHHSTRLMSISDALSREVARRAILFDQDVYATISRCGLAVSNVTIEFHAETFEGVTFASVEEKAQYLSKVQETRKKLRDAVAGNVDEFRQALVREFRRIMTVDRRPEANASQL